MSRTTTACSNYSRRIITSPTIVSYRQRGLRRDRHELAASRHIRDVNAFVSKVMVFDKAR